MNGTVVDANGIQLWCDAFGDRKSPPILLIMGNSCQGILWPDLFCEALAQQGRYVIRFDQRDTGLSTSVDYTEVPYTLLDIAEDAIALLNALDIQSTHIVGLSQGGTIAFWMALRYPDRIRTITAIMSSPDLTIKTDAFQGKDTSRSPLPPPDQNFIRSVLDLNAKSPASREERIEQWVENFRLANGPLAPFEPDFWRALQKKCIERIESNQGANDKIANHSNHSRAQAATKPIAAEEWKQLTLPVLILHGTCDPIFPFPHAEELQRLLPNAQLHPIANMGHALAPPFWSEIESAIVSHTNNLTS